MVRDEVEKKKKKKEKKKFDPQTMGTDEENSEEI